MGKAGCGKAFFIVCLKGHTVGTSFCLDVHRAGLELSLPITTVPGEMLGVGLQIGVWGSENTLSKFEPWRTCPKGTLIWDLKAEESRECRDGGIAHLTASPDATNMSTRHHTCHLA